MQIEMTPLPSVWLQQLHNAGCTVPKRCYGNCLDAVTNYQLAEKYVLCFVELANGEKLGHAVIKVNEHYYDPTLEPQGPHQVKYWWHSEYTKTELRDFVKAQYRDVTPNNGQMEVFPPSLRQDGTVVCEEVIA
ncbi:hypothetical protein [Pseudomonas putida]|uniref:hypothetical protein n=1 Tax=Pseudomonas putida TaxID=303 RepID=UPI003D995BA0